MPGICIGNRVTCAVPGNHLIETARLKIMRARPPVPPRQTLFSLSSHQQKMAASLKSLNQNAEVMKKDAALFMNINAAKGLHDVMRTNLGPKGTVKM